MQSDQAYADGFQSGRDWWGHANAGQKYRLAKALRKADYGKNQLIDSSKPESPCDQIASTILGSRRRDPASVRTFWEEVLSEDDRENPSNPEWLRGFVDGAVGMWRPN